MIVLYPCNVSLIHQFDLITKHLFTLFVLISFMGNAQLSIKSFEQASGVEERLEVGTRLSYKYGVNYLDSLMILSNLLINSADSDLERSLSRRVLGSYLVKSGQLDASRVALVRALKLLGVRKDFKLKSEILNEIGNSYFLSGDGRLAIEAYLLSINVGEGSADETSFYNGMLGAGKAFCMAGDTTEGLLYVNQFIKMAKKDNKHEALADSYAFLGMIQMENGEKSKSNWSYKQSLYNSQLSGSKLHLAHSFTNRAILDYQNNVLDSSLCFFEKSLKLRKEIGNSKTIVESYFNLANYYLGLDDVDQAIEQLKLSERMALKFGFIQDELDAIELIDEYSIDHYKTERINELKMILSQKNTLSEDLKIAGGFVRDNARHNPVFISKRENGSILIWSLITVLVISISIGVIQIQNKLT